MAQNHICRYKLLHPELLQYFSDVSQIFLQEFVDKLNEMKAWCHMPCSQKVTTYMISDHVKFSNSNNNNEGRWLGP